MKTFVLKTNMSSFKTFIFRQTFNNLLWL